MAVHDILLSFVGNRDPFVDVPAEDDGEPEAGPVLSLLRERSFSRVVLFCTGSGYVERARMVQETFLSEHEGTTFNFVSVDLDSPIDYREIYGELRRSVHQLRPTFSHLHNGVSVLLDPGTPQMQTAWFLLVASGYLEAELLQGIPPRFAGGAYKVRKVELGVDAFPGLAIRQASAGGPNAGKAADEAPGREEQGSAPAEVRGRWIQASTPHVVGSSRAFQSVMDQALSVSRYDVSVVVRGETGTGKEVVARHIHASSGRAGGPFVAVNCAAVSASLSESEFFGHVKGAFTGAHTERLGQFRAADGGTVFLDEVGDLPLETQAKLLRVLENRTLTPVGGDKTVSVDVRVIAATNRDLEQLVADGHFRRDLYERLAQVTLTIPPLRERKEDIPLLLRHFLARWNETYGEQKGLSEESFRLLVEYPWPGNVRELQNAVASTCAIGRSGSIGPEVLPAAVQRHFGRSPRALRIPREIPEEGLDLRALLHNLEKSYYEEAIRRTGGNAEKAARLLGLQGAAFRKAARERLGVAYHDAR